jgi:hypothetical protein
MFNMKVSLAEAFPDIACQWHPILNGDLKPDMVSQKARYRAWWQCEHGHEWNATIGMRTSYNSKCPFCSNKKVCKDNCLATLFPKIAAEWHPTKNELNPYEITRGLNKKVWWLGNCGHEWSASISGRTLHGKGCPYCSGGKVCTENCLATLYPDIAKQWHPTKNGFLTPNDVTSKSAINVWWLCDCGYEWYTRIQSKTRNDFASCPACNESQGEIKIRSILSNLNVKFERQYRIKECRNKNPLPFDYAILNPNLKLIEFHGKQHYEPIIFFDGQRGHEALKIRDDIKFNWCKQNQIPLLIIPYWEKSTEEKVIEFINSK